MALVLLGLLAASFLYKEPLTAFLHLMKLVSAPLNFCLVPSSGTPSGRTHVSSMVSSSLLGSITPPFSLCCLRREAIWACHDRSSADGLKTCSNTTVIQKCEISGGANSMWNLIVKYWQAVALWWPLLVAIKPVIFVTLASTTKKVAASNTDHYRRFHCSLKWNVHVCMCRDSAGGGGESGMVYSVGVGPHNIPHCCLLLKKTTPLPEWRLDMWNP